MQSYINILDLLQNIFENIFRLLRKDILKILDSSFALQFNIHLIFVDLRIIN